jgi:beta-lactamase class A
VNSVSGTPVDTQAVQQKLAADLSGLQGHYGVAVVDLASGTSYGVRSLDSFRAASVNKLPILVALYQRAVLGQVNLDRSVAVSDGDIQHYGTGTIQNAGAPRVYTLRQLAALMIQVSDNTAAYILERLLGQSAIQESVQRWGLTHTSMADNATTPADAAEFMASLYADKLLPADGSQAALDLLAQTAFNDRLAGGMPRDVIVAHKVGTDTGIFNDAGVVLLRGRPYSVAVFSEDADQAEADAAYARVNQDLLHYESSLPPVSGG